MGETPNADFHWARKARGSNIGTDRGSPNELPRIGKIGGQIFNLDKSNYENLKTPAFVKNKRAVAQRGLRGAFDYNSAQIKAKEPKGFESESMLHQIVLRQDMGQIESHLTFRRGM